jgi:HSP20 family protein
MRYRRISYRYALLVTTGEPRPLGEIGNVEREGIRFARMLWRPPADVFETDAAVHITVELAGVNYEELEVLLYDDALVVEGQRRLQPVPERGHYHKAEIRQGPFRLEVPLPAPINPDRVDAVYDRGLLRLTLARDERR